ncbi:MAG: PAS domain-containing sensor histidine kinase [Lachnospiraceae bacterium]|nr:PAS domain-containing sensor histidine kinase [Lachnospiraceae bacterium]
MKKYWSFLKNGVFSIVVWLAFFVISVVVENWLETNTMVPAIFALAVFLISLYTDGYIYGILVSLLSVLVLNYAFTFPFLKFNFSIPENLISAIIMLIITILSSALATKIKNQEKMKAETYKETMRANLLRAVSHDLRTPLTTIYGCSCAIEEKLDSLSKEQLQQLIQGIKEDSQWLIGMVENLLSVTRIDTDGVKIVKTPTVLEELIDIVLMRFKKRYPGQKIFVDIPEEFISIPMDAVLIEQVIVNILENAVQHATGMTKLEIKVFTRGNQAVFEIRDDGCGIDKERMENIFTGYFEMKEAPVDHQKRSMGIGLSVCSTIIRAHGGRISVENRKEGGCVFRFMLDMEEEESE